MVRVRGKGRDGTERLAKGEEGADGEGLEALVRGRVGRKKKPG